MENLVNFNSIDVNYLLKQYSSINSEGFLEANNLHNSFENLLEKYELNNICVDQDLIENELNLSDSQPPLEIISNIENPSHFCLMNNLDNYDNIFDFVGTNKIFVNSQVRTKELENTLENLLVLINHDHEKAFDEDIVLEESIEELDEEILNSKEDYTEFIHGDEGKYNWNQSDFNSNFSNNQNSEQNLFKESKEKIDEDVTEITSMQEPNVIENNYVELTNSNFKNQSVNFQKILSNYEKVETRYEPEVIIDQLKVDLKKITPELNKVTVQLNPQELGSVGIEVDFSNNTIQDIKITVEKIDTYNLLQKDTSTLRDTLNEMGFKFSESSLSFNLEQNQNQQNSDYEGNQKNKSHDMIDITKKFISNYLPEWMMYKVDIII